jgi:hypothetical protein
MQSNATNFIRSYSKQKLETELRTLKRLVEEKRKIRDRAVADYAEAANNLLTCEQLFALKQSDEKRASRPNVIEPGGEGKDQTSSVLALIRGTGELGIRPKEIAKELETEGLEVKPAYLHTILMRLKKRGAVKSVRGSYISVE